MEEQKFDILAPREDQLGILVSYFQKLEKGYKRSLPVTTRTKTLISRYLWNWKEYYDSEGITPKGALVYYKKLMEDK